MKLLAPTFPREIAFPKRQFCRTEKEFYRQINQNNKLKNIYYSLYQCDENRSFKNTLIDKIAFDFDNADLTAVTKEVLEFHHYLMERDFKHTIIFSGRKGYHVYIFTQNAKNLRYIKGALYNAHKTIMENADINPDEALIGDIKRIIRVPNTWHLGGKRYCIPISVDDLEQGVEHILEKAQQQNFTYNVYGKTKFDLAIFDKPIRESYEEVPEVDYDYDLTIDDNFIDNFLPCVKAWLLNAPTPKRKESGTWEARYQFALYCRDIGLPKEKCIEIAKKYFSKVINKGSLGGTGTNFDHFMMVNAADYAYNRNDFFNNCDTLWAKGLCPGRCEMYKKGGSPMYK